MTYSSCGGSGSSRSRDCRLLGSISRVDCALELLARDFVRVLSDF